MSPTARTAFHGLVVTIALAFTAFFAFVPLPPALASGDIVGAFAGGFVNPYAAGYSMDVLGCWGVLTAWIIYEARTLGIRGGVWCVLLGVVPGVVVGFAVYLVIRDRQLTA